MKSVCIVIACYNEIGNIAELYNQLTEVTDKLGRYRWEFLVADNCSTDGTDEVLRGLAKHDKRVKVILNQANYGVARSYTNAIYAADSDAIIIMASDLEDPPELINDFVKAWDEEDYKVVLGQYEHRQENFLIRMCRKLYYCITMGLSEYQIEGNLTGFGLMDRSVVDLIKSFHEPYIHVGNLTAEMKYKIKYITFNKPSRHTGRSSYSFKRYYRTAMENIVMSSQTLLHAASFFGGVLSMGSVIVAIIYLIRKIINWQAFELGMAPLVIGIFLLGGVQLFFIGIVGEYLGNALKRITVRPYVIERERINFDKDEDIAEGGNEQ